MQEEKEVIMSGAAAAKAAKKALPKGIAEQFHAELKSIARGNKTSARVTNKILKGAAKGIRQLGINEQPGPGYRLCYILDKKGNRLVVLHCFKKTSEASDKKNMETAIERQKEWNS